METNELRWPQRFRPTTVAIKDTRAEDVTGGLRSLALDVVRTLFSYRMRVRVVAMCLPRTRWFAAAYLLSRMQDRIVLYARRRTNGNAPASLNVWLVELTRFGTYPIPQRVSGAECLRGTGPKLIQFPHVLYYEMAIHAVAASVEAVPHVVSGPWRIEDGRAQMVGSGIRLPALAADSHSLVRARGVFRQGGSVISLADAGRGGPLRPEMMMLAGKLGVQIVFVSCELAADGVFDIAITEAPRPYVLSPEDLKVNLNWLANVQARDLLGATTH